MSLRTIDVSETQPRDWILLGAGRANAVFVYQGSRADLVGHVLRLSKPKLSTRSLAALSLETEVWHEHEELLQADAARQCYYFAKRFMAPRISKQYLPRQVTAYTGPSLVSELLQKIGLPSCETASTAMLLHDNTVFRASSEGPTVCVELKPKWGLLPKSKAIHPDHAIKLKTSRFRLHQTLKMHQGKIERIGGYDPIELFSEQPKRAVAAIVALLRAPQNNLQLFRDGRPAKFSGLETPQGSSQLADALSEWCDAGTPLSQAAVLAAAVQAVLHDSRVLAQISLIQQMDEYDIEGVWPLYEELLKRHRSRSSPPDVPASPPASPPSSPPSRSPQSPKTPSKQYKSRSSDPKPALQARQHSPYQETIGQGESSNQMGTPPQRCCNRAGCSAAKRMADLQQWEDAHARLHAMSRQEHCAVLRSYMMAASAKDCSVMIAMRPVKRATPRTGINQAQGAVKVGTQIFEYKVAIADLDFKPIEKIEEHKLLDAEILLAAKKVREARLLSNGFHSRPSQS